MDYSQCVRVLSDRAMQLVKLQQQIEQLSKSDTDSVRIYGLDASAAKRLWLPAGVGQLVVGIHLLIDDCGDSAFIPHFLQNSLVRKGR